MTEPEQPPDVSNAVTGNVDGLVVQAGTVNGGIHYHDYRPPPPAQSGDTFTALVDTLLEVPSVRDEDSRKMVLALMRREIADAVPHHQRARLHVIDLVRTCLNYDGGLNDLLGILRKLEGDSIPVRRSEEAMRALLEENVGT